MPDCNGLPRVEYHRTYVLLPPNADAAWATAVIEATWNTERWTLGGSADDAGLGDLAEKGVVAINPGVWMGDDGTALEEFFETYYPGTGYLSLNADTPADLKAKLLALVGGSQPDSPF